MGVIEPRSQIEVSVIKNLSDLTQAMDIRSVVFVGEYGCTEDEEFDGNDFSATQIIAKVGGKPAGTMRLRYFADFVIPERLAVLPAFRKGRYGDRGVAYALATFGFKLARMKGYRRFIGYSVVGLEQFWDRVAKASGGKVDRFGDHPIECSGSTCIGVFGSLEPMPGAIHPREHHEVLTACEAEIPQHVMQKAEMLQTLSSDALLVELSNPGRRASDHRATDLRAGMRAEGRQEDRRATDRRASDRRGNDRRAGDRRMSDRRQENHFGLDGILGQDQRFVERRMGDRRAGDRRAADRRMGDRRCAVQADHLLVAAAPAA
ncbi:hypothetical protein [Dongia sp.]|uniref:hypothetical protein n=1 Tax=Dongia sp. TaxID=1977262 RepID=UPI0035B07793